eukprot:CAMPEP_0197177302 /NCGR_PEP_ID=MMETSP1423-20130617/2956_1 /TAXON_ID=476441 /ORGANISM="Pseudo-nitzschia heimii, Strain UNC1101" /LENGTH=337 /DNA_ID=CAMNT_0042626827 /DNA_START=295 /DNA_END=1308 /DNA_ORIENTATION=-
MMVSKTSTPPKEMTLEEARDEVKKCDEEIQSIKAALRSIGSTNSSDPNSLEIEFTKVEGLPDTAKPALKLQLSSPIEELDVSLGGEKATFEGVETSIATLVVDAEDANIPLGTGENPIEIAPLCMIEDPKQPKDQYVKEVAVAIVAAAAEPTTDAKESETKGEAESDTNAESETKAENKIEGESENKNEAEAESKPVICTMTIKVTYKPSSKDQREALYDLLNKTSQKKSSALSELRKRSVEKARAGASAAGSTAVTRSKPAVKPGFLKKGGNAADDANDTGLLSTAKKWYQRVTGPDSIVMKTAFWTIATKDFLIFFGAVGLMHYKGNVLSLPPPM